jgi:hypothetical protein
MTRAMQPFKRLTMRGQLGRFRRLGEEALQAYELTPSRLVPLAHDENTTFLVIVDPGGIQPSDPSDVTCACVRGAHH